MLHIMNCKNSYEMLKKFSLRKYKFGLGLLPNRVSMMLGLKCLISTYTNVCKNI